MTLCSVQARKSKFPCLHILWSQLCFANVLPLSLQSYTLHIASSSHKCTFSKDKRTDENHSCAKYLEMGFDGWKLDIENSEPLKGMNKKEMSLQLIQWADAGEGPDCIFYKWVVPCHSFTVKFVLRPLKGLKNFGFLNIGGLLT